MTFKDKPIRQWGENDYLEAHIELWTRIRNIWSLVPYIDLCEIKNTLVQEMTPELEPENYCYLCACYFANECGGCPLKIDKSLQCHPNYYELCYSGYNKDYIDEIIDMAKQRLHKIKLEAINNVKQS